MTAPKVHDYLDRNGVAYEVQTHEWAIPAHEVAHAEGVTGWDFAKSVILKLNGDLVMAVVPAPVNVDLAKARAVLGGGVRLATEPEFAAAFPDCEVGAAPPFGNLYGMPVLLDRSMRERDRMICRDGSHTETVTVAVDDYVRVVQPRIVDIATEPS
ncbi:MAG: YbaK/EbsC family protein [Actinomycetota bacterium]|nr:YbaK/EbsC family protein [Actinomycetota bacterium]